jgi:uncharacterized membrane protein HdeD (DUF308 family)
MTVFQRIKNLITGLLLITGAVVLLTIPEDGFLIIAAFIVVSLLLMGIRYLFYYFHMARNMVGGKYFLFLGIFLIDLGLLTFSMTDEPRWALILYLLGFHAFSCVVNLAKGIQERHYGAPAWKVDTVQGIVNAVVFFFCLFHLRSPVYFLWVYCAGLFYSAAVRIVSAFRRTAIVYIQ